MAAEAGQTGVLLRLRPIRLAAEGEGRELVPQLLRAALARSTTAEWPDRPLVPGLMMRYDAALGQDMLSGLADAGDAATLAASLVDCLERLPQAAVESLTLIDRLSEPLRSRTRLLGAMALLDGPAADRAEVLLDAVPVSDTSPADLRVLHGFVAARLGRPAGLALLRAALDDLGGDTRAWAETLAWRAAGRDDILAALGLLMPDGQPDPRYRLASALGLARQQPLSAAEPLLAALAVHPQWSTTHWRDYGETPFERALSSQYLRTEHVQELQCAVTRLMLDLPLPQARRLVDRWPDYLRPAARLLLATRAAPAELNQAVDRDMADWPPTALLPLAVGVAPSVGPSYVWRAMAETRRRNQLMFQSPETIAYMAHQPAGLVALAMMQPGSCRAGIWEFGRRWWCALAMVDPYGAARKALDTGRPGADRAQGEDLVDVAEVLALSGRYRLTRYWANEAQLSPLALAVTRPAD